MKKFQSRRCCYISDEGQVELKQAKERGATAGDLRAIGDQYGCRERSEFLVGGNEDPYVASESCVAHVGYLLGDGDSWTYPIGD